MAAAGRAAHDVVRAGTATPERTPAPHSRTRDAAQRPRRAREGRARRAVVCAARALSRRGLSNEEIAQRLGGPEGETIRRWRSRWRRDRLRPASRGRRPKTLTPEQRTTALALMKQTRGGLSRDALCAALPAAPTRALRDLHRCWTYARGRRASVLLTELTWTRPGSVVAFDLTDVPHAALGEGVAKLFYARDLAADFVHEPVALADKSAAEVVPALLSDLARYGVPLVVKRDNERTFGSAAMRAEIRRRKIVELPSPPYYPQYNGGIERVIGVQKTRTERIAALAGRPGAWRLEDVLRAQREHNELARPWGTGGPTPQERFDAREKITAEERQLFRDTVAAALHSARRQTATIPAEQASGRRDRTSAMKRSAIATALVDLGDLKIRRRRVTPAFSRRRAGRIT